jgi:hypothetical protein
MADMILEPSKAPDMFWAVSRLTVSGSMSACLSWFYDVAFTG